MRKLTILIIIVSLAGSVSCKKIRELFGDSTPGVEAVEEVLARNQELRRKIMEDSLMHLQELKMLQQQYEQEIEKIQKSSELQKEVKGYFVVVGSFKQMGYAEDYSKKVKSLGYEGALVEGPNNFTLVTSGTHNNLKDAIVGLKNAREKLAMDSWVYIRR